MIPVVALIVAACHDRSLEISISKAVELENLAYAEKRCRLIQIGLKYQHSTTFLGRPVRASVHARMVLAAPTATCMYLTRSEKRDGTYLTNVNSSVTPGTPVNLTTSPPKSGSVVLVVFVFCLYSPFWLLPFPGTGSALRSSCDSTCNSTLT